jgi:hypothetical protein
VLGSSRDPLISARVARETKARFAALAASRGSTESALLTRLVETVLEHNAVESDSQAMYRTPSSARITLRLRPGDHALLGARAAARGMKPASYLVMLTRAHLRRQSPLPNDELSAMKAIANQLSALRATLQRSAFESADTAAEAANTLPMIQAALDGLRERFAAFVRIHLTSWETDDDPTDLAHAAHPGPAEPRPGEPRPQGTERTSAARQHRDRTDPAHGTPRS